MGLDFDVSNFLHNLKATKPPYECPVNGCGKIYKSFSGIQVHLENFDHSVMVPCIATPKSARKKNKNRKGQADQSPSPVPVEPVRVSREPKISYIDSSKTIEYEADGVSFSFHIYDQLPIMSKEEYEALVPPAADGGGARSPEPAAARPSGMRSPTRAHSGTDAHHAVSSGATAAAAEERRHKLPEAQCTEVDECPLLDAPPMPNNYIRFIEKSTEELDEEVEYDMDEEDAAWLEITNEQRQSRGLQPVKEADLEMLMDRLEKESYFQAQTTMGTHVLPTDEEAVCCICMDGECENSNVILFCDMCNLAVHQECYGVPYIPEGQWWCRRCLQSPSRAVDCVLCPNKGGAFKQTDDARWAHVVCALWVPEVCFANTVFLEPIDSIDRIPPARWKLSCYICKQRNVGACIQCHKANCYTAFHVTCAQQAGMHMKIDAVRETSSTGTSFTVRKAAYCDMHTPADSDARPNLDDCSMDSARKAQAKAESRLKMRKARKILAERRSAVPVVSVPTIPPERVKYLASLIEYPRKNHFIQRLLAFWTLKRYARNGVPLLRRLQVSTKHSSGGANRRSSDTAEKTEPSNQNEARKQLQYWQRLRQDLEKVRLLCELVRKREKTKRELIKSMQLETRLSLSPLRFFLEGVIDQLAAKDNGDIFADPVDTEEVTDYLTVVTEPMDLSTMRLRVQNHEYTSLNQLVADFDLMMHNCLLYNTKDTMFYKAGVRMRHVGGVILRKARRDLELIGFHGSTGLLMNHVPDVNTRPKTDEDILEQVDRFLCGEERQRMSHDDEMNALFEHLSTVETLKHGGSRIKWTKALKVEISKIRRLRTLGFSSGRKSSQKKSNRTRSSASEDDGWTDGDALSADISSEASSAAATPGSSPTGSRRRPSTASSLQQRHDIDSAAAGDAMKAGGSTSPPRRHTAGSSPRRAGSSSTAAGGLTPSSPGPTAAASPAGVNRRTAVLFNKKIAGNKNSPSPQKRDIRKRMGSGSAARNGQNPPMGRAGTDSDDDSCVDSADIDPAAVVAVNVPADASARDSEELQWNSFTEYRQSRGATQLCSDDETGEQLQLARLQRQLAPPGLDTGSDDSEEDELLDDGEDGELLSAVNAEIPLEALDLVWAKCRGYPWYPALIINPKMPRTGYFHNGVPIPVPPEEVLALADNHSTPMYLVLFFDAKRTWQWLPRGKLEPLGVDPSLDQAKLVSSRKATDRKAVRVAYEKAVLHQCRVSGTNSTLTLDDKEKKPAAL